MYRRLLGIRPQAMEKIGKKFKPFLSKFQYELGSWRQSQLTVSIMVAAWNPARGVDQRDLLKSLVYQCLVGCIEDQSGGPKHYDCLYTV